MSISVRSVPGTSGFERGDPQWWRRFGFEWYHDWSSFLFWRVNWSDFTFVHLACEAEWCMSNAEITAALLGFHVRFTYYWPSETRDDMKRTARLVEAGILETTPIESLLSADAVDPHAPDTGKPSTRA